MAGTTQRDESLLSFSVCRAELQRPGGPVNYQSGPYDFMALTRVASIPGHGERLAQ